MFTNLNQFDRDLQKAERKLVAQAEESFRSIALAIYSDFITPALTTGGAYGSPVASGRFAASINVTINSIDYSTAAPDPAYRYREPRTIRNKPISAVAARLRTFKLGDTIWISNSVPYVRRIEAERWSWQSPDGVFKTTIARAEIRFRNIRLGVFDA